MIQALDRTLSGRSQRTQLEVSHEATKESPTFLRREA